MRHAWEEDRKAETSHRGFCWRLKHFAASLKNKITEQETFEKTKKMTKHFQPRQFKMKMRRRNGERDGQIDEGGEDKET